MAATLNARCADERGKNAAAQAAPGRTRCPPSSTATATRAARWACTRTSWSSLLAHHQRREHHHRPPGRRRAPRPALIREVQYHPAGRGAPRRLLPGPRRREAPPGGARARCSGTPGRACARTAASCRRSCATSQVECLPKDIPEAIEVDVAGLDVGDTRPRARPARARTCKILNDERPGPLHGQRRRRVVALPETPETEDGVGGDVEPELIRDREGDAEDVPFEHGSRQPE